MSTTYQTQTSTRTISYINQANTIGATSRAGNAYPDLTHVIFFLRLRITQCLVFFDLFLLTIVLCIVRITFESNFYYSYMIFSLSVSL
jgi:hypothetical protein